MKTFFRYMVSPLLLFATWEAMSRGGILDIRFFPPPSVIFYHLLAEIPSEELFDDIGASLYRIVWGYALGATCGAALGILMGLVRLARTAFYPLVAALYPIPKIAVLPLIMLIFGIGDLSKVVVVAIGSFFLVLINTLHGVDTLPRIHHDVARVFAIRRYHLVRHIVLPGSLPAMFTGLKLALGYSLVIVVAAEFSGADAGIGYRIWQSWETFSLKTMYSYVVVIGILGFIFSFLLEAAEKRVIRWHTPQMR